MAWFAALALGSVHDQNLMADRQGRHQQGLAKSGDADVNLSVYTVDACSLLQCNQSAVLRHDSWAASSCSKC